MPRSRTPGKKKYAGMQRKKALRTVPRLVAGNPGARKLLSNTKLSTARRQRQVHLETGVQMVGMVVGWWLAAYGCCLPSAESIEILYPSAVSSSFADKHTPDWT